MVLSTDFLSAERRARLLAACERCVRDDPVLARRAGPPNWLVRERQKKDEHFLVATDRVRREYFSVPTPSSVPTLSPPQAGGVSSPPDPAKSCLGCGRPWAGKGTLCWNCKKKRQRGH